MGTVVPSARIVIICVELLVAGQAFFTRELLFAGAIVSFAEAIVQKARGSSFYVRELLVAEESFFTQQSSFAGGIVVCRRQRSKRENCHSMHESC